jgi:hypothetical protein
MQQMCHHNAANFCKTGQSVLHQFYIKKYCNVNKIGDSKNDISVGVQYLSLDLIYPLKKCCGAASLLCGFGSEEKI